MKLESHSEFNQQNHHWSCSDQNLVYFQEVVREFMQSTTEKFSMLMQAYDDILSAPEPELPSHEKAQVTNSN